MYRNSNRSGYRYTNSERNHIRKPEHLPWLFRDDHRKRRYYIQLVAGNRIKQPEHCKPCSYPCRYHYLYRNRYAQRLFKHNNRDRNGEPCSYNSSNGYGNDLCRRIHTAERDRCNNLRMAAGHRIKQCKYFESNGYTVSNNYLYRNRHKQRLFLYGNRYHYRYTNPCS